VTPLTAGIDLYWLPIGAGAHLLRWNGRVYEAVRALVERRAATELYHSALRVSIAPDAWAIEMTPVWAASSVRNRGVVAEGAVGSQLLGCSRIFRYEVHCWRDGVIDDLAESVESPVRLTSDEVTCRRVLSVLPSVPTLVWGRDELRIGDMWNSNSVTAWALTRSGLDGAAVRPPVGGSAPGWQAGLVAAARQQALSGT
jgi:hypothetical protein